MNFVFCPFQSYAKSSAIDIIKLAKGKVESDFKIQANPEICLLDAKIDLALQTEYNTLISLLDQYIKKIQMNASPYSVNDDDIVIHDKKVLAYCLKNKIVLLCGGESNDSLTINMQNFISWYNNISKKIVQVAETEDTQLERLKDNPYVTISLDSNDKDMVLLNYFSLKSDSESVDNDRSNSINVSKKILEIPGIFVNAPWGVEIINYPNPMSENVKNLHRSKKKQLSNERKWATSAVIAVPLMFTTTALVYHLEKQHSGKKAAQKIEEDISQEEIEEQETPEE
jgi:hypothetical protein